jgi:hypothetical protein
VQLVAVWDVCLISLYAKYMYSHYLCIK